MMNISGVYVLVVTLISALKGSSYTGTSNTGSSNEFSSELKQVKLQIISLLTEELPKLYIL